MYLRSHRLFSPALRRANRGWFGRFVPDPSGCFDWRVITSNCATQWVVEGGLAPLLQGEISIDFHRYTVTEDVMGWLDDPLTRARLRFFSGVEWTCWESDGTRAWASGSSTDDGIELAFFHERLDRHLTDDPEVL